MLKKMKMLEMNDKMDDKIRKIILAEYYARLKGNSKTPEIHMYNFPELKEMNNEMFLDKVIFAVYENYSKTVKSTTNLEIGVLNMQKSSLYTDLIKWLKTQSIWNE